jgi:hypothetical protein
MLRFLLSKLPFPTPRTHAHSNGSFPCAALLEPRLVSFRAALPRAAQLRSSQLRAAQLRAFLP